MKRVLSFAAISEAATGLALLVVPSLVVHLLLGQELPGGAYPLARVAGIALLSLGMASWPRCTALAGMTTYSLLVTAYLAWLGTRHGLGGPLLWPAVALHALLTLLLVRQLLLSPATTKPNS